MRVLELMVCRGEELLLHPATIERGRDDPLRRHLRSRVPHVDQTDPQHCCLRRGEVCLHQPARRGDVPDCVRTEDLRCPKGAAVLTQGVKTFPTERLPKWLSNSIISVYHLLKVLSRGSVQSV